MYELFSIDEELFYRHGPDTGEWGAKYTDYDLVKVLKLTEHRVQVSLLNHGGTKYVSPGNLYRKKDLKVVSVEVLGIKQPRNIIKGSVYGWRDNPGMKDVYGVCIDDGKLYLLKQFAGRGYLKEAKKCINILND